jgi:hypothetical protein
MPLLEINQSARSVLLSGLILLPSRSISAPLSSTPTDGGVAKALNYVLSKDRRLSGFSEDTSGQTGSFDIACP